MSLDYNLAEIKEHGAYDGLWDETDHMYPWVQSIIFATMTADIGYIADEVTAAEFFARVTMYDRAILGWAEGSFTPQQLHTMIGLRTNVQTLTRAQWLTKLKKRAGEELRNLEQEYLQEMARETHTPSKPIGRKA